MVGFSTDKDGLLVLYANYGATQLKGAYISKNLKKSDSSPMYTVDVEFDSHSYELKDLQCEDIYCAFTTFANKVYYTEISFSSSDGVALVDHVKVINTLKDTTPVEITVSKGMMAFRVTGPAFTGSKVAIYSKAYGNGVFAYIPETSGVTSMALVGTGSLLGTLVTNNVDTTMLQKIDSYALRPLSLTLKDDLSSSDMTNINIQIQTQDSTASKSQLQSFFVASGDNPNSGGGDGNSGIPLYWIILIIVGAAVIVGLIGAGIYVGVGYLDKQKAQERSNNNGENYVSINRESAKNTEDNYDDDQDST